jgi:hypothetical protein
MNIIQKSYETLLKGGVNALIERLLIRKKNKDLQKYLGEKKWDKAANVAAKLVMLFPDNTYYKMRLASCYHKSGNNEKAFSLLKNGLKLNMSLEELIIIVEKKIGLEKIKSNYLYLGGWQNLGFIEHEIDCKKSRSNLITKISTVDSCESELLFFKIISKQYPEIKKYTPELINILELKKENLSLITMEKINGRSPNLDKKLLQEVINVSTIISSMSYSNTKNRIPLPIVNEVQLKPNRLISCLHFLMFSHKKSTNKELFVSLYKYMEENSYSANTIKIINILESIIMKNELYNHINPELHFSVQHGDFSLGNFMRDSTDDKLYIIDWGHMRVGPRWIDLAGFLGRYNTSFHTVNDLYLSNLDVSNHLEPIERLFFVYTLIIAWFSALSPENFEKQYENNLLPAIHYVKKIANELDFIEIKK